MAIAGDPERDIDQGFDAIITDKEGWKIHQYDVLPDPSKGKENEKKLLGAAIENLFTEMIALAPKNYCMRRAKRDKKTGEFIKDEHGKIVLEEKSKGKGVSMDRNPQLNLDTYKDCLHIGKVKMGKNVGFKVLNLDFVGEEKKVFPFNNQKKVHVHCEAEKIAMTGINLKGVTKEDISCPPFILGIGACKYVCA
jgi:hypothetical protein